MRLEPAILRLRIQAFTNWAIRDETESKSDVSIEPFDFHSSSLHKYSSEVFQWRTSSYTPGNCDHPSCRLDDRRNYASTALPLAAIIGCAVAGLEVYRPWTSDVSKFFFVILFCCFSQVLARFIRKRSLTMSLSSRRSILLEPVGLTTSSKKKTMAIFIFPDYWKKFAILL